MASSRKYQTESLKMTMWADNVKFVKDIVDSKYAKIETAAADVRQSFKIQIQNTNTNKNTKNTNSIYHSQSLKWKFQIIFEFLFGYNIQFSIFNYNQVLISKFS